MSDRKDVIIIGAGTSGLAALREVRKRTENFLIINDGPYGTTCARVGCMPSKVLIEAAHAFHARHDLEAFGVRGAEHLAVDRPAVLRRVRMLRDKFVDGVLMATADLGERNVAGRARLLDAETVEVAGQRFTARNIIIATGSRPVVPEKWRRFGESILTTDTLFEQDDLPQRMAVIGLGAIGCEMAQALARLGVQVTAFELLDRMAGLTDPQVNAKLAEVLEDDLIVQLGAEAHITADPGGLLVTGGDQEVEVDAVLAALGRRPNIQGLGLENLGVELDDRGMPPFDPQTMRIGELPVYFAGDVNGQAPLLHEAADEGYISALNATGETCCSYKRRTSLAIVFSDPQVAVLGHRFGDLDEKTTAVAEFDFRTQARARMAEQNRGLLRIYADKTEGRLLGAEMCVPQAEHLAHLLALAVDRELTVRDLLGMPFYHPTVEEGLRSALRRLDGELPSGRASDLACLESFRCEGLD